MSTLPHHEALQQPGVTPPELTVIDGGNDTPHFVGGEPVVLTRGEAVAFAKSERPLYETMEALLGRVGLLPEDQAEQDALHIRLDMLAREAEETPWVRTARERSYAPDALIEAREATEDFNDVPILHLVEQVRREYPNPRNQRLELIARRLIEGEIAQDE